MSTLQLSIWPELVQCTDGDLRMLEAIERMQARSADGRAHSLFQVATEARLDYPWAHNRLPRLELLRCIRVKRNGPGVPMEMWRC